MKIIGFDINKDLLLLLPMIVFLAILFVFIPIGIIYITEKSVWFNKIGPVIIAYILGIALGHSGIMPKMSEDLKNLIHAEKDLNLTDVAKYEKEGRLQQTDILTFKVFKLQELFNSISIPLALPLLLFSFNVKVWLRMSGKTLVSMVLAIISVIIFIVLGHMWFGENLTDSNKVAGMLVGLYTGGTPNLASLKQTLGVDNETYIMTHTYDTAMGTLYLFFLISVGKNIFRKLLVPYPHDSSLNNENSIGVPENSYKGFFELKSIKDMSKAMITAVIVVGVSLAIGYMFKNNFMLAVMLSITTLSILVTLVKTINKWQKTFELGMYFIVVFSFVVASMADIHELISIPTTLLAYITLVYFGSLSLHFILCRVFKVNADILIVTSTALLCSPPFVPMVAASLKNKEVIASGLTVGIMGYAIGNYLGILIAAVLK